MHILMFVVGCLFGFVLSVIMQHKKSGKGYFKLDKVPDEEDLYTVDVRLLPDQDLNKKNRIILTRE